MRADPYIITNVDEVNTPALVVYPSIMQENIRVALSMAGKNVLRPHVKTCKAPEVVKLMQGNGIRHFKCATLAEAEMLALTSADDVLLAYQPTATAVTRLKALVEAYPATNFSCLIDNSATIAVWDKESWSRPLNVFLDFNAGMNRTGVAADNAVSLINDCNKAPFIHLRGIHVYDGNINDESADLRKSKAYEVFKKAVIIKKRAEDICGREMEIVIGGTPTFPMYAQYDKVQCSPGTFVFWDWGYSVYSDLPFTPAAILLTRVVSIINAKWLCLDIGHKAVSSENPIHKRLKFLNIKSVKLLSHSEEHLVVEVPDTSKHFLGEVWYAVPYHICPTVALYNELDVIVKGKRVEQWQVTARNRRINF